MTHLWRVALYRVTITPDDGCDHYLVEALWRGEWQFREISTWECLEHFLFVTDFQERLWRAHENDIINGTSATDNGRRSREGGPPAEGHGAQTVETRGGTGKPRVTGLF